MINSLKACRWVTIWTFKDFNSTYKNTPRKKNTWPKYLALFRNTIYSNLSCQHIFKSYTKDIQLVSVMQSVFLSLKARRKRVHCYKTAFSASTTYKIRIDSTAFSISNFPNESVGGTKMWKWKLRGYCVFKIIHLHSHTVDSIWAVIFLCLSFPICEMVQVRIYSFTIIFSHTLVPLCSHTNFLFWKWKGRIVIKTACEQASLIPSQWLHSKGWTHSGTQVPQNVQTSSGIW